MTLQRFFQRTRIRGTIGMYVLTGLAGAFFFRDKLQNLGSLLAYVLFFCWFRNRMRASKAEMKDWAEFLPNQALWKEVLKAEAMTFVFVVGSGLLLIPVLMLLYHFLGHPDGTMGHALEEVSRAAGEASSPGAIMTIARILTVCIAAPVVEELMFRGVVLHRLQLRWGIRRAIVVSSLAFGLLHPVFGFLGATLAGVFTAFLYLKTRNICFPIMFHMVHNVLATIAGFIPNPADSLSLSDAAAVAEVDMNSVMYALAVIGAVLVAISLFFIVRYLRANWPVVLTHADQLVAEAAAADASEAAERTAAGEAMGEARQETGPVAAEDPERKPGSDPEQPG